MPINIFKKQRGKKKKTNGKEKLMGEKEIHIYLQV